MSKKILIEAFFSQFNSFMGELKQMYPDDEDFPVFITTLSLMKSTNPMLVLNYVKSEIIDPYGAKIAVRDESFFLNQDYTARGDVDLNVVDKLKQYIAGMSPETKETVWKYIEIITKLCSKALDA
uniref:Uncharacterized protein n=1 Tax=viral metagenome TaxID=1070528 RepID=A0A6C0F3H7_9ZZZZ